jgi:malto-oligosyltrehalose trehalohydrolase
MARAQDRLSRTPAAARSRHSMPFGAEVLPSGGVRFALWAPAARRIELVLDEGPAIAAVPDADGWVRLEVGHARAGTRYRYRIDGEPLVPDPASRFQPDDVHGPSEVIDAQAFEWTDGGWRGRAWESLVFYELHVGTFTPAGTLTAAEERLDYLADLGVTAVELMPLSDFPGRWGWGYDGVLPFAPESRYGRPEALKAFVQACHARGLAVFLDVVYNHFGPEGNYLGLYAPRFFDPGRQTPWGAAINFGGEESRWVRAFFRENALYWLEEYHVDGLRLDAVHAIHDASPVHILDEIAAAVHSGPGAARAVHLVLENDENQARLLRPGTDGRRLYSAQWNDDVHHALHVLATGERDGYYADYTEPIGALARCLTEGFAYQGEHSAYRGAPRGTPTGGVPLTAFVAFLQNHDQIGNRAFGERLEALAPAAAVEAVTALVLLAPSPPLLFMGEEWSASAPFLFFCDFGPDLGPLVTEGRRREFAQFPRFRDPATREQIPDPLDVATVRRSVLDWTELARPAHRARQEWTRRLLRLRQQEIVPLLDGRLVRAEARRMGEAGLTVDWAWTGGRTLRLLANLSPAALDTSLADGGGRCLFATTPADATRREVSGWHTSYYLSE